MNKILLQCDNLSKRYQEGTVQTDVLHNVSFSVGEGEMMAIVGSSGSGKSTLLHLLGGLDTPTNGDVIFSGQPMSKMSSAAKAELRNRELGFIYQFHHLLPDFTALENVAMPLLIGKKKPAEINARASDMLKASPDEQVVVLSMGGNLETAFVLPAIYSNQFAPPSDSVDGCVTEYPDGGWFEYEPATGRWHVRGIKSMVIEAADNITLKTGEFVVEASNTRINSEVVINGGVTQGGGAMSSNGIVVDKHDHTGVKSGGDTSGGPV